MPLLPQAGEGPRSGDEGSLESPHPALGHLLPQSARRSAAGDDDLRPRRPVVRRLILQDFRSYAALDLRLSGSSVVLTGDNGVGKTNLLEALSLLTPGRGLRRAEQGEIARAGSPGRWAVSVDLAEDREPGAVLRQLGTGSDAAEAAGAAGAARRCRIDRAGVPSAKAFADHLRIVWLTPAMDGLFGGPAAERRRFLDRIVLTVDADHATRVNALDRALRNRNRILEAARTGPLNRAWADAAEREVAAVGVAVAAARLDTVERLAAMIRDTRDDASPFPWAAITLAGTVEDFLRGSPALEAEERFRDLLRAQRPRDIAAGRTGTGPHLSDLAVRHGPKDIDAARASTGEQKALVVGLVLAQARLVAMTSGIAPLVLLDEIAAHFDPSRRRALFKALRELGGQVFMTGADPAAFDDAVETVRYAVEPGAVTLL